MIDERKFVKTSITEDIGEYHAVTGHFEAERFPGSPLLDTSVNIKIEKICITWDQKEELMKELATLLERYQI